VSRKIIPPGRPVSGAIELPGDKSISHRYAILSALAEGRSEITNFSTAADCRSTLLCLRRLGVKITETAEQVIIEGRGLTGLRRSFRALHAGNSGTTARLLAGVLAGHPFASRITGDSSLRRRPMRRMADPLELMGAQVRVRNGEFAPLDIRGGPLHPIDYTLPVPSAQVKSAILLAGLYTDGWTTVCDPAGTRDHAEIALREFGAELRQALPTISIRGGPTLSPRQLRVPGDFSSAAFFAGLALILPGSELLISNVGLNPTRTAFLDVLAEMGAAPHITGVEMHAGELVGSLLIRHASLAGGVIRGAQVSKLIDELPLLAALAPYTEQGIEIRDAIELRAKETDRITTLCAGLRALGAHVMEFPDGLRVEGRAAGPLRGGAVNSCGDHRIAMALSIAALAATGHTTLRDAHCVDISFPEFFSFVNKLTADLPANVE
jgi:3-phosphoshikimate 1-carboxyvinyltransferase